MSATATDSAPALRLSVAEGLLLALSQRPTKAIVDNARALLESRDKPARGMRLSLGTSKATHREIQDARSGLKREVRRLRKIAEADSKADRIIDPSVTHTLTPAPKVKLKQPRHCPKCGAVLPTGVASCPACNADVSATQSAAATPPMTNLRDGDIVANPAPRGADIVAPSTSVIVQAAVARRVTGARIVARPKARGGRGPAAEDFNAAHPRRPRGRVGGGEFAKKGDGMGASGPSPVVGQLQDRLAQLGYRVGRDGQFGNNTEAAVKQFQHDYGLAETGKVDAATAATMRQPPPEKVTKVIAEKRALARASRASSRRSSRHSSTGKVKASAAKGPRVNIPGVGSLTGDLSLGVGMGARPDGNVKTLQKALDDLGFDLGQAGIDGRYGPDTTRAVRELQAKYGLTADGIVGKDTLALLQRIERRHQQARKRLDIRQLVSEATTAKGSTAVIEQRLEEAVAARKAARTGADFTRARAREVRLRAQLEEATFSTHQREKLAVRGVALPDGSFPIRNRSDLANAVRAIGRASDAAKARAHIIKRARALGAVDSLPPEWRVQEAQFSHFDSTDGAYHTVVCDGCKKSGNLSKLDTSTVGDLTHTAFKCDTCGHVTTVKNSANEAIRDGSSRDNNTGPSGFAELDVDPRGAAIRDPAMEEAGFEEDLHPRGRGGRWVEVLNRLRQGESTRVGTKNITRVRTSGREQFRVDNSLLARGGGVHYDTAEDVARRVLGTRTPKQQERFDAATHRAQQLAQDRSIGIENRRVARAEGEALTSAIKKAIPGATVRLTRHGHEVGGHNLSQPEARRRLDQAGLAWRDVWGATAVTGVRPRRTVQEAVDSMVKASTPEPFSTSRTSNWVARGGGLPAYIQHIAHALVRDGKSESNAIQMAIGIVKRWAKGVGRVDANTRAAAAKAVAEWEALKGKSKVATGAKAAGHALAASDDSVVLVDLEEVEAAAERLPAGVLLEAMADLASRRP